MLHLTVQRWRALAPRRRRRLSRPSPARTVWGRLADRAFALLDLVGVADLYETLTNAVARRTRPLSPAEVGFLRPIFGDSVPYALIRIDERAYLGPSWANFFYVSFHTVNAWGRISPPTLVHEVVHVWQYVHRGACYVPRALYAQRTAAGYDYGGLEPLAAAARLEDFNYEQQADIIEDAYRLANGYPSQWTPGRGPEVLPYYFPYLAELRSARLPADYRYLTARS